MKECLYCHKQKNEELKLYGMDGDFIHPSCIPKMEEEHIRVNLMTEGEFFNYMFGEWKINIAITITIIYNNFDDNFNFNFNLKTTSS